MTSMLETIVPKSDQLNFDDLSSGRTLTIKVTKVLLAAGDQPVTIQYENDNGKPYKPGKSMRRVLVHVWGADAAKYAGRSMTLYGDAKVVFGGAAVGGIRISHMSDITEPVTLALTATRAQRKPFTVQPLKVTAATTPDMKALLTPAAEKGIAALETAFKAMSNADKLAAKPYMDELKKTAADVDARPASAEAKEELF